MKRTKQWCAVCTVIAGIMLAGCGKTVKPEDFQKTLQERLIAAKPGDVIELPAGKFHLDHTLSLTVSGVTLRGRGMDKTVLSFAGQKSGSQGLLVKANDFTVEDVGIEDTAGDALTIQGGTNIIVRRVRTEWTRGPNSENGPYGIYPVECKNLLVEDSVARGAADAGIYVGQSQNVVIRRNRSEFNVDALKLKTRRMWTPTKTLPPRTRVAWEYSTCPTCRARADAMCACSTISWLRTTRLTSRPRAWDRFTRFRPAPECMCWESGM